MGYSMVYGDWTLSGSDMAADAASVMIDSMVESLEHSLAEDHNRYNTSGAINVALIFDTFILPLEDQYVGHNDNIVRLAKKTIKALSNELNSIRKWKDSKNKEDHIDAYSKLIMKLKKFVADAEGGDL